jgi:succinate dehydrogenase/fumarate reductase-like Fe-S protein
MRQLEAQLNEAQHANSLGKELEQLKLQRECDAQKALQAQVASLDEELRNSQARADKLADQVKALVADKQQLCSQMEDLQQSSQEDEQELQEHLRLEKEKSQVSRLFGSALFQCVQCLICTARWMQEALKHRASALVAL